jgi:hypothetical protein
MKTGIAILMMCAALVAGAEEYVLETPVQVWAEETVRSKQIMATSYRVEQLSILRLPGGGLQCRAILVISDGTNSYRRVLTATQEQLIAAIGADALAALVRSMGETVGKVLEAQ